jgi:TonB family protein
MRVRRFLVLFALVLVCCETLPMHGQQTSTDTRAVVRKVMPLYPDAARRINLSGTVKLLATVAPNGTVKAIQPMGGSPLLVQAAQEAVYRWQFAPASSESKIPIELHFNPQ